MKQMQKSGVEDGIRERPLPRRLAFMRSSLWAAFDVPKDAPVISMDHPKRGERILSPEYTFRIETSSPEAAEISIDGGDWRPCRRAVGYWWYDWSGYRSGVHQVVVRLRPRGGEKPRTQTCHFRVDLSVKKESAEGGFR